MKMDLMKKKKKKGFTLIELIVVIAILGILAAIAVPRFSGFTNKAKIQADEQYGKLVANTLTTMIATEEITQTSAQAASDVVITITPSSGAISAVTNITYWPAAAAAKINDATELNAAMALLVPNKKTAYYDATCKVTMNLSTGEVTVGGTTN